MKEEIGLANYYVPWMPCWGYLSLIHGVGEIATFLHRWVTAANWGQGVSLKRGFNICLRIPSSGQCSKLINDYHCNNVNIRHYIIPTESIKKATDAIIGDTGLKPMGP